MTGELHALIFKELKNNLLSSRFMLAALIITVIMVASFAIRLDDYSSAVLDNSVNRIAEKERLREVGSGWQLMRSGIYLERPVMPLSLLVTGVEGGADQRARLMHHSSPVVQFSGSVDRNPLKRLSLSLDVMVITGIIISLLVLVLCYDAIAGERESGTLKLLLSFPVKRSTLILGKWIGGYVTLIIPFVVSMMLLAIWIIWSDRVQFNGGEWIGFLAILCASLLYIAWVFSAALLVSSFFRQGTSAMCMLLFGWVLLVLVVPNASPYIAAAIKPVESTQEIKEKTAEIGQRTRRERNRELNQMERELGIERWWYTDESRAAGLEIVGRYRTAMQREVWALAMGHQARINEQTALARNIGRVSPFVSYANIVTTLAWTGADFQHHLMQTIQRHETELQEHVIDLMIKGNEPVPDLFPRFEYESPGLARRFVDALADWLILISSVVVLFLATYVNFVQREII